MTFIIGYNNKCHIYRSVFFITIKKIINWCKSYCLHKCNNFRTVYELA